MAQGLLSQGILASDRTDLVCFLCLRRSQSGIISVHSIHWAGTSDSGILWEASDLRYVVHLVLHSRRCGPSIRVDVRHFGVDGLS